MVLLVVLVTKYGIDSSHRPQLEISSSRRLLRCVLVDSSCSRRQNNEVKNNEVFVFVATQKMQRRRPSERAPEALQG